MPLLRPPLRSLATAAALAAGLATAQTPPEPFKASAPLALELRDAQWFDGEGFRRGTLYVVDGKFTAEKPKRVNRRMELRAQFLIPPLAEAHNYNLQNGWGVDRYAQRYLQDGVFYAAMLCADPSGVDPIRSRLAGPEAPDVLFVTACITSSDGQPLGALMAAAASSAPGAAAPKVQDFADKTVLVMDTPEQVEQKWAQIAPRHTDWIKVVLSHHDRPELRSRSDLQGRLGMTPETVAAVVRHAHRDNLRVVAHVDTAADFEAAVLAGVDLIAHLPGYYNPHGEALERFALKSGAAAEAARRKVAVITATATTAMFKTTVEQQAQLRQVQARNLEVLKAAGVTLLLGSDMFNDTAQAELRSLAQLNVLTPAELLKMATITTPRTLFAQRKLGCFEPGCEASFLLLASNPLERLEAVEKPLLRVKQGRLLTQLEDVAEGADDSSTSTEAGAARKARKASAKTKKAAPKSGAKSAPAKRR